jgi:hypothetical protein
MKVPSGKKRLFTQGIGHDSLHVVCRVPNETCYSGIGQSLIDWFNFLRDVCVKWCHDNPIQLGGQDEDGNSVIVELDESACGKRKFNKSRRRNTRWVFGGIERATQIT